MTRFENLGIRARSSERDHLSVQNTSGRRLQLLDRVRDLALFDLAIDSKLRGCDVVSPKSLTWRRMGMRSTEHPSVSVKLGDRFASKSQSKHARQLTTISPNEVQRPAHTSSLDADQRRVT